MVYQSSYRKSRATADHVGVRHRLRAESPTSAIRLLSKKESLSEIDERHRNVSLNFRRRPFRKSGVCFLRARDHGLLMKVHKRQAASVT